jgi:hypothetical protein
MSQQRAERRRSWPVRVHVLGAEPGDDLSQQTTPEARLAMMWELAVAAYTLARLKLPDYARHETPVSRRPLASRPAH